MNLTPVIVGVCGLIAGVVIGYQSRPSAASRDGRDFRPAKAASDAGTIEATPQQRTVNLNPDAKPPDKRTVKDSVAATSRSVRLAGLIGLIKSATNAELVQITSDLQTLLREGKLSPSDFAVVAELLGERGSAEVAVVLLKSKSATGPHREAISLYFSAWSRADAGSAWSFAKKHYEGKPAEKIQIHPPSTSPFPEHVLKGLVQGTQDWNFPGLFAIHKGGQPLDIRIAMWQMEQLVRSVGFGGAIAAVKKDVSGEASEQQAFNKIAAISDAAIAAGSDAIRETATILTAAGSIAPSVFPDSTAYLAQKYAETATVEAFEWGKSLTRDTSQRSIALSRAVFQMGMKDADKALEWVGNLPAGSPEERLNLVHALDDAFKQSPRLTSEERHELLEQTGPMIEQLRPKRAAR